MIENLGYTIGSWAQQRGLQRAQEIGQRRQARLAAEQEAQARANGLVTADEAIESWKLSANRKRAEVEGLNVQIEALKQALVTVAPKHPLLQNSTVKFQDGTPKSVLRLMLEKAFDKYMIEKGYNPLKYRKN